MWNNINLLDAVPVLSFFGLVLCLIYRPNSSLSKPALIFAIISLISDPSNMSSVIAKAGLSIVNILSFMTALQLCIVMIVDNGAGERFVYSLATISTTRKLLRVPATILIPLIVIPAGMLVSMLIQNIPTIVLLTPIVYKICQRLEIPYTPLIFGLIPATNLGVNSVAWSNMTSILHCKYLSTSPTYFTENMVVRNVFMLFFLTLIVIIWSFLLDKKRHDPWLGIYEKLRLKDSLKSQCCKLNFNKHKIILGTIILLFLCFAQMFFSNYSFLITMAFLAFIFLLTSPYNFSQQAMVLGEETILTIIGLLILSTCMDHSYILNSMAKNFLTGDHKKIELMAYILSAFMSADGAAAMLASVVQVHYACSSAATWSLATGICAGSSALLTSVSAGPILFEVSKRFGMNITFRRYAFFGLPISLFMLFFYAVINHVLLY